MKNTNSVTNAINSNLGDRASKNILYSSSLHPTSTIRRQDASGKSFGNPKRAVSQKLFRTVKRAFKSLNSSNASSHENQIDTSLNISGQKSSLNASNDNSTSRLTSCNISTVSGSFLDSIQCSDLETSLGTLRSSNVPTSRPIAKRTSSIPTYRVNSTLPFSKEVTDTSSEKLCEIEATLAQTKLFSDNAEEQTTIHKETEIRWPRSPKPNEEFEKSPSSVSRSRSPSESKAKQKLRSYESPVETIPNNLITGDDLLAMNSPTKNQKIEEKDQIPSFRINFAVSEKNSNLKKEKNLINKNNSTYSTENSVANRRPVERGTHDSSYITVTSNQNESVPSEVMNRNDFNAYIKSDFDKQNDKKSSYPASRLFDIASEGEENLILSQDSNIYNDCVKSSNNDDTKNNMKDDTIRSLTVDLEGKNKIVSDQKKKIINLENEINAKEKKINELKEELANKNNAFNNMANAVVDQENQIRELLLDQNKKSNQESTFSDVLFEMEQCLVGLSEILGIRKELPELRNLEYSTQHVHSIFSLIQDAVKRLLEAHNSLNEALLKANENICEIEEKRKNEANEFIATIEAAELEIRNSQIEHKRHKMKMEKIKRQNLIEKSVQVKLENFKPVLQDVGVNTKLTSRKQVNKDSNIVEGRISNSSQSRPQTGESEGLTLDALSTGVTSTLQSPEKRILANVDNCSEPRVLLQESEKTPSKLTITNSDSNQTELIVYQRINIELSKALLEKEKQFASLLLWIDENSEGVSELKEAMKNSSLGDDGSPQQSTTSKDDHFGSIAPMTSMFDLLQSGPYRLQDHMSQASSSQKLGQSAFIPDAENSVAFQIPASGSNQVGDALAGSQFAEPQGSVFQQGRTHAQTKGNRNGQFNLSSHSADFERPGSISASTFSTVTNTISGGRHPNNTRNKRVAWGDAANRLNALTYLENADNDTGVFGLASVSGANKSSHSMGSSSGLPPNNRRRIAGGPGKGGKDMFAQSVPPSGSGFLPIINVQPQLVEPDYDCTIFGNSSPSVASRTFNKKRHILAAPSSRHCSPGQDRTSPSSQVANNGEDSISVASGVQASCMSGSRSVSPRPIGVYDNRPAFPQRMNASAPPVNTGFHRDSGSIAKNSVPANHVSNDKRSHVAHYTNGTSTEPVAATLLSSGSFRGPEDSYIGDKASLMNQQYVVSSTEAASANSAPKPTLLKRLLTVEDDNDDIMELRDAKSLRQCDGLHFIPWDQRSTIPKDTSKEDLCGCFLSSKFWDRIDWSLRVTFLCVLPAALYTMIPGSPLQFSQPGMSCIMALTVGQPTFGSGIRELFIDIQSLIIGFCFTLILGAIKPANIWQFSAAFFVATFVLALCTDKIKRISTFVTAVSFVYYYMNSSDSTMRSTALFFANISLATGIACISFFIPRINWSLRRARKVCTVLATTASISISGICRSFWTASVLDRQLNLVRLRQLKTTCVRAIPLLDMYLEESVNEPHFGVTIMRIRARRELLENIMNIISSCCQTLEVIAIDPSIIEDPQCQQFGRLLSEPLHALASALDIYLQKLCDFDNPLEEYDVQNFDRAKQEFDKRLEEVRQETMFGNEEYTPSSSDIVVGSFLFSIEEIAEVLLAFEEPKQGKTVYAEIIYAPFEHIMDSVSQMRNLVVQLFSGRVTRRGKEAIKFSISIMLSVFFTWAMEMMDPLSGAVLVCWVYQNYGAGTFNKLLNRVMGIVVGSIVTFMFIEFAKHEDERTRLIIVFCIITVLTFVGAFIQTTRSYSDTGNAFIWGVVSVGALNNVSAKLAITRFTANVIAAMIYFIVTSTIWPIRTTLRIKTCLDEGMRAFREAATLILRNVPAAEPNVVVAGAGIEIRELNKMIVRQETLVPAAVEEPTMIGGEFPKEQWYKLIRTQKNLGHILSLLRFAFCTFSIPFEGDDAAVNESVHWDLIESIKSLSNDIGDLIYASVDMYLMMLSRSAVVPTYFLVRLRVSLMAAQQELENCFINAFRKLLIGEDLEDMKDSSSLPFDGKGGEDGGAGGGEPGGGSGTISREPTAGVSGTATLSPTPQLSGKEGLSASLGDSSSKLKTLLQDTITREGTASGSSNPLGSENLKSSKSSNLAAADGATDKPSQARSATEAESCSQGSVNKMMSGDTLTPTHGSLNVSTSSVSSDSRPEMSTTFRPQQSPSRTGSKAQLLSGDILDDAHDTSTRNACDDDDREDSHERRSVDRGVDADADDTATDGCRAKPDAAPKEGGAEVVHPLPPNESFFASVRKKNAEGGYHSGGVLANRSFLTNNSFRTQGEDAGSGPGVGTLRPISTFRRMKLARNTKADRNWAAHKILRGVVGGDSDDEGGQKRELRRQRAQRQLQTGDNAAEDSGAVEGGAAPNMSFSAFRRPSMGYNMSIVSSRHGGGPSFVSQGGRLSQRSNSEKGAGEDGNTSEAPYISEDALVSAEEAAENLHPGEVGQIMASTIMNMKQRRAKRKEAAATQLADNLSVHGAPADILAMLRGAAKKLNENENASFVNITATPSGEIVNAVSSEPVEVGTVVTPAEGSAAAVASAAAANATGGKTLLSNSSIINGLAVAPDRVAAIGGSFTSDRDKHIAIAALDEKQVRQAIKHLVLTNEDIHSVEAFIFGIRALVTEIGEFEKSLLEMHNIEEINDLI